MAKRALHLLENTERVRDIGRLRTQLSAIMLAGRPAPARGRPGAAAARRHRARLERGHPGRPGPQRAGQRAGAATSRATPRRPASARLAVLETCGDELPLLSVDALTLLGQVAWSTGDREGAQDWYRRAISDADRCRAPTARPRRSGSRSAPWPPRPGWSPSRPTPSAARPPPPASAPGSPSSTRRPSRRRGPRRRTPRPVGYRSSTRRRHRRPAPPPRSRPPAGSDAEEPLRTGLRCGIIDVA